MKTTTVTNGPWRCSFGPAGALTGPPARMPAFNTNLALGLSGGATGTTVPATGQLRRSPLMRSTRETPLAASILQELANSKKRVAPNSLNVSASSLASSSSSGTAASSSSLQPDPFGPGCSKWSSGSSLTKKMRVLSDLEPPSVSVGTHDPLGLDLVELRQSEKFKTDDSDMAARKYVLPRSDLSTLEASFERLQERALAVKKETGGDCTGDFPVINEYVVSADIRTPVNKESDCTINKMVTPSSELRVKPKLLLVGDSTLTTGHASKSGNTFFAKFVGQSTDEMVPPPIWPINLTQLGDDQQYELYTFAISGLSAAHGLTLSPAELKRRVFEAFGATEFVQFTMIGARIGANDIGSMFVFANVGEQTRSDLPEGYPRWLSGLHEEVMAWCRGVAVEFDAPVAWLGAGCLAPKVSLSAPGHCDKDLHLWSYPFGDHDGRNRAFNELSARFAGMILEKSTGTFVPVKNAEGVEVGRASVCSFASQLPPNSPSASGTGHPGQRHMARFLGNMLNSMGILLCKVANNSKYVTYYIENPGIPPRWTKDDQTIPHAKFVPLAASKMGKVDRLTLTKQSDWPQSLCTADDQHQPAKRDYDTRSADAFAMTPGQLVRIKLGSGDEVVYHGAMVVTTLRGHKLICVSLLDERVHLLASSKVWAFSAHHKLLPADAARHQEREAKSGRGGRASKRLKK
jgi:hypothetical protein